MSRAHVLDVQASADGFARFACPLHILTIGEQDALAEGSSSSL